MFGVYIQVHIKCFLTFLEAHSLHIFLEIFYQLWPAQASSELGLIYQLWLAQKQSSPAACSSWARLSASLLTMFHLVWSWSCSDTFTLCEDAPQNSVTYYGPSGVILISFRYLHTLWCCLLNTGKLSEWVNDNGLKLQIMRRVGRGGITIPSKAFFSLLCLSI